MAKRFTDTDKWKKEWFYELHPNAKLAWLYLLDQCDHTGIWNRNFKLMSEQIGFKIDQDSFFKWFGIKVILIDEDKYFIPSFFDYQYGDSKDSFKAKQSALQKLRVLGLVDDCGKVTLPNTSVQSMDCPIISKSIININLNEGIQRETKFQVTNEQLQQIYDLYPRKSGTTDGFIRLRRSIKSQEDLDACFIAVRAIAAYYERNKTEKQYMKMFSTWTSTWKDSLEPDIVNSSTPDVGIDWNQEASICFQAVKHFPPDDFQKAREWLGEERFLRLKNIGGLKYIRGLQDNDWEVKRVATMLKSAKPPQ